MDRQELSVVAHVLRTCVLLFTLLVAACGGGQGGSSGEGASSSSAGSSSSQSSASGLWVNNGESLYLFPLPNSVVAADYAYETSGRVVNLTVAIQGRPESASYFAGRYSKSAIDSVQLSWSQSTQAYLNIVFKAASTLTPGTYSDIVQLQLCEDASCLTPLDRSFVEIAVAYTVVPLTGEGSPSIQLNPAVIDVEASEMGPSGFDLNPLSKMVDVSFENFLTTPYLMATPQGSVIQDATADALNGVQVMLQSPATLGQGTYSEIIALTVCLDGFACKHQAQGSPYQIQVNYRVTDTYIQSGTYGFSWRLLAIPAIDLVWNSNAQRIYAVEVLDFQTGYLTQVDPVSKTVDWRLPLAVMPRRLVLSSDGLYAYVWTMQVAADLSQSDPQLIKVKLSDQSIIWTIDLPEQVNDMKVSPGVGTYIAISTKNDGLYLYRSDTGAVIDSDLGSGMFPRVLAWGDSEATLYAYSPSDDVLQNFLPTMASLGFQSSVSVDLNSDQAAWSGLHFGAGILLENHGAVYDMQASSITSRLNIRTATSGASFKPYSIASELDMAIGRSYFWYLNGSSVVLQSFDMNAGTALADFPTSSRQTFTLIRWGSDGLAYLHSGNSSEDSGIALVQGLFVAP